MKLVVPDASVILKWVLPSAEEPDAEAALRLRDTVAAGKLALRAPGLWLYEVGNILTRNFPVQALALLEALIGFGIPEGDTGEQWRKRTVALVQDYRVTFYDAAYHALALVEHGVFITADRKYFAKAKGAGAIALLAEFW
ncbi:MAG: type II toxin-antitoxin system VapC family toxin [Sulfuricaulis sp.]